ncbi:MAG: LysR family transcriptional regulator [Pyramidobacter sp.]|nr:LysR family transcriptional regulator [Pyramidobacter sp.]
MNLITIQTFLSIAHQLSISLAAEEMLVSQSTISHRLKTLEEEVGMQLVERRQGFRGVTLSPQGRAFIPIAEKWLALWNETMNLKSAHQEMSLSIASIDSVNVHLMSPLYRQLAGMDAPFHLQIRSQQSPEIYRLIEERKADIGFVILPMESKQVVTTPILKEKMLLVSRRNRNLPRGAVHPSLLDSRNELYMGFPPEIQRWHDRWWNPSVMPHVRVDTAALLLNFMDSPAYWAICPLSVARSFARLSDDVELREFSVPPPPRVCYMLENRTLPPSRQKSAALFKRCLEPFVEELNALNSGEIERIC